MEALFNATQNVLKTNIATKSTFPACFCMEQPNEYKWDWNTDRMYRADLRPLAFFWNGQTKGNGWGLRTMKIH